MILPLVQMEIPSPAILTVAGSWAFFALLFIKGVVAPTEKMVREAADQCKMFLDLLDRERQNSDKWEDRYMEAMEKMKGWAEFGQEALKTAKKATESPPRQTKAP